MVPLAAALIATGAISGCAGFRKSPVAVAPSAARHVVGPLCDALPSGTSPGNPAALQDRTGRRRPGVRNTCSHVFDAATRAAGMTAELNDADGVTILAPTDDAFSARFTEDSIDALLLKRTDELRELLDDHIVDEAMSLEQMRAAGSVTTRGGDTLTVVGAGENVRIEDKAETVCGDYQVANTPIHVIDKVLDDLPDAVPSGPGDRRLGPNSGDPNGGILLADLGDLLGGHHATRRVCRRGADPTSQLPWAGAWRASRQARIDRDWFGRGARRVRRPSEVPVGHRLVGGHDGQQAVLGVRRAAEDRADRHAGCGEADREGELRQADGVERHRSVCTTTSHRSKSWSSTRSSSSSLARCPVRNSFAPSIAPCSQPVTDTPKPRRSDRRYGMNGSLRSGSRTLLKLSPVSRSTRPAAGRRRGRAGDLGQRVRNARRATAVRRCRREAGQYPDPGVPAQPELVAW